MNENMICFSLNFIFFLKEKLYILIKLEEVRLMINRKLQKNITKNITF